MLQGAEILFYPTAIGTEPHDGSIDSRDHWKRVMQGHAGANLVGSVYKSVVICSHILSLIMCVSKVHILLSLVSVHISCYLLYLCIYAMLACSPFYFQIYNSLSSSCWIKNPRYIILKYVSEKRKFIV